MSSPAQGMWVCRHNADGRDWCPDCYSPAPEPYEGPDCPKCGKIAYTFQGGHAPGCIYAKPPERTTP